MNIDSFCNELPTITKISQENKLWIFTDHFGSFIKDPTILSSNEIKARDSTFIPHKKIKITRKLFGTRQGTGDVIINQIKGRKHIASSFSFI